MRTSATIVLRKLHPTQRKVVQEARRFNVVCCGRRWGKTSLGIDRVAHAIQAGKPIAWFSPTYRMLAEVWREVLQVFKPVAVHKSATEHRIELSNGTSIDFWSLDNPDTPRGRAYVRVIIDEAALVKDLEQAWLSVIRPCLTDFRGDAWFLSTPKGLNYFWTLFNMSRSYSDWASWQFPTSANPHIEKSEIDAAQDLLPEMIFRQEYLAEFITDAGAVFRRVHDAATAEPQSVAVEGHTYVIGVDWGKLSDYTVFAVLDCTDRALVYLDRMTGIDYTLQAQRLKNLSSRFGNPPIIVERNSIGEPIIEILRALDLNVRPVAISAVSKPLLIENLALAFEKGEIRILNHPVLISELMAYEGKPTGTGSWQYSAPQGMHDDTVMALALAWSGVGRVHASPIVEVINHVRGIWRR